MSEVKLVSEMVGPDTAPMGEMRVVFFSGGSPEATLRGMDREDRDALRGWFDGSPHYAELVELIDRINQEEAAAQGGTL
jgi:hypothetical protein